MKVLLVHNFYRSSAPSGEDIVVRNELKMLLQHCDVVTYFKKNDDLDDGALGSRLEMATNAVWCLGSYREMVRLIEKHKPDLIHIHNTFPQISPSVYWAATKQNVPVVQTLHNYRLQCANGLFLRNGAVCELCANAVPYSALRFKCYRDSVFATAAVVGIQVFNRAVGSYRNHVDAFIALTEFSKRKLQRAGGKNARFFVKPNFLPSPPPPGDYPRKKQAVFVGRLTEEKGAALLVRAWPPGAEFRLLIVGDGALRAELEAVVRERKLNIVFMGHCGRERVLQLLRESALQIIPSISYEGFPMVVLEAYACGTAILASRLGGLAETVVDGGTGRLFPAGDINALRNEITNMLNGDGLEKLGREGRRLFEQNYSEEKNAEQLLDIYQDVLNRKRVLGRQR